MGTSSGSTRKQVKSFAHRVWGWFKKGCSQPILARLKNFFHSAPRRRWAFQNIFVPLIPWLSAVLIPPFALGHVEWRMFGFDVYAISMMMIAFNVGLIVSRVESIIPGDLEAIDLAARSLAWYVCGVFYVLLFSVYNIRSVEDEVHEWFWGRAIDLTVISFGVVTVIRAIATCRDLKLDLRKN